MANAYAALLRHGGPGHEVADVVGGMAVGELGKGGGQQVVRVDAVKLAVPDECRDYRAVIAASVGASEQGILNDAEHNITERGT